MGEQKDAGQPQQKTLMDIPPPVPPQVNPPQAPPNPDPEEGDHEDKPKKSSTISDKVMVFATCVIAVGTLVSAGAIVMQWQEMVGGGTQTDKIIAAANAIKADQDQLVLDNRQVLADNRQALSEVLRENREELGKALKQNRDALQAQTTAVQNQTETAERPWIKVVSVMTRDASSFPALSFQQYGPNATWANLFVYVTIENIGPSVAVNTNIEPILLTPAVVQHDYGKDILATESAFCSNARKTQTGHNVTGATIFPNDPFERHSTLAFAINPKLIQHPPGSLLSKIAGSSSRLTDTQSGLIPVTLEWVP